MRLSDQPARHLSDELFFRRQKSHIGSAKGDGDAKRLRFAADDIGIDRWPHDAERKRLGYIDDEQRSAFVDNFGNLSGPFNDPKKVWRLDYHGGGWSFERGLELCKIELPGFAVRNLVEFDALMLDIGLEDLPVFRMKRVREKHAVTAGNAHRHETGFSGGG